MFELACISKYIHNYFRLVDVGALVKILEKQYYSHSSQIYWQNMRYTWIATIFQLLKTGAKMQIWWQETICMMKAKTATTSIKFMIWALHCLPNHSIFSYDAEILYLLNIRTTMLITFDSRLGILLYQYANPTLRFCNYENSAQQ